MKWFSLVLLLMLLPTVFAIDFDSEPSEEDKATFDAILEPVLKVYNLVKYIATSIAVVVLLFAGVTFITSGNDPKNRETAKSMGMSVIIGLVVIWAAPLVVNFIV